MGVKKRLGEIRKILKQIDMATKQWEAILKESLSPTIRQRLENIVKTDQRLVWRLRVELSELESQLLEYEQNCQQPKVRRGE